MKLADIDRLINEKPGVRIVSHLEVDESGVDPIGLRQINLDLMDHVAPGINNVTQHVRYYTFMSWAAWKATTQAASEGIDDPNVISDLMERYEAFYAWSHFLNGRPFRGSVPLRRTIARTPAEKSFPFEGEVWDEYKRTRTSIMAPTEYGPSIKALRYLRLDESVVPDQVMPAVMDFEACVQALLPPHLFAVTSPLVSASDIAIFAKELSVEETSEVERRVFRFMFHSIGADGNASSAMRRRKATIDYLLGVLNELGPSTTNEIRRRFVENRLPAMLESNGDDVARCAIMLTYLQVRQLQRLATEAMLLWTERVLSEESEGGLPRAVPTEELIKRADEAAAAFDEAYGEVATVGAYLHLVKMAGRKVGWPAAAARTGTDIVDLMEALKEAQRRDISRIPYIVVRSLAVVKAVNDALSKIDLPQALRKVIDGRPDRLPMDLMAKRLDAISERPRASLWTEVIESWVIGQHVHWSAFRGGDGKQRLRIGLEGGGWIRVRKRDTGNFVPTPDRLYTMLLLLASSGIIRQTDEGRFAPLTTTWSTGNHPDMV